MSAFPIDDVTLDAIEHALGGAYTVDEDGEPVLHGADMSLPQLLDFLSGYDPAKLQPVLNEYDTPMPDVSLYPEPLFSRDDVIRALIAEVRRLRAETRDTPHV